METTPQGQAADAAFVKWLTTPEKEAGVIDSNSSLAVRSRASPASLPRREDVVGGSVTKNGGLNVHGGGRVRQPTGFVQCGSTRCRNSVNRFPLSAGVNISDVVLSLAQAAQVEPDKARRLQYLRAFAEVTLHYRAERTRAACSSAT